VFNGSGREPGSRDGQNKDFWSRAPAIEQG